MTDITDLSGRPAGWQATALPDYPGQTLSVISVEDEHYRKQGYRREDSVFEVSRLRQVVP